MFTASRLVKFSTAMIFVFVVIGIIFSVSCTATRPAMSSSAAQSSNMNVTAMNRDQNDRQILDAVIRDSIRTIDRIVNETKAGNEKGVLTDQVTEEITKSMIEISDRVRQANNINSNVTSLTDANRSGILLLLTPAIAAIESVGKIISFNKDPVMQVSDRDNFRAMVIDLHSSVKAALIVLERRR